MEKLQPVEEILLSWKRCMRKGLSSENAVTGAYVKEVVFQKALNKSRLLISLFENLGKGMDCLSVNNNRHLGQVPPEEIALTLLKQLIWGGVLFAIGKLLWRTATKRLVVQGG